MPDYGFHQEGREGSCPPPQKKRQSKTSRRQAGDTAGTDSGDLAFRHFGQYCLLEDTPGCQVSVLRNGSEFGPSFRKLFPNGS